MKRIRPLIILCTILFSCQQQTQEQSPESITPTTSDTTTASENKPIQNSHSPSPEFLIEPGERIGNITLGMTAEELGKLMGKPDSGDAAMGKAMQFWISKQNNGPRHYLAVYTINNFDGTGSPPKVNQVQVTSPQFQTQQGISTGDPFSKIRAKYKPLKPLAYYQNKQSQQVYIYDNQASGIAFEITLPDSICTAISIHQKGEDVPETYLPVHPDRKLLEQP